ncbi:hypothetical protein [Paramagnetospirillum kuznetsovii]|uniref:hypothetical protein n=1 Tax=Paramagnetospirillum kuznetsovii TaxID=2053833 RepID=UPI00137510C9|nr:hypothetical protein [Paramagnetospirillum kuznetsovii]
MRLGKPWQAALLAAMILATPRVAQAVDVYVVEAKGIELAPGQVLDGAKPLSLAVGQKLVLVTADGRTIKLKGPSEAAPAAEVQMAQADMAKSLKGLMTAQAADTTSAGVVRSGGDERPPPPEPWLVDVRHGGDHCVMAGGEVVLWRGLGALGETEIEISPSDRSWRAKAPWPAGEDRLALPASLPLHNGKAYLLALGTSSVAVTIHAVPASLGTDAARAAWLLELGCGAQARALVNGAQ